MRNKRRVWLAIFHRGGLSVGVNRERRGLAAYHWAIVISPKVPQVEVCTVYDVTDAINMDLETNIDLNPSRDFRFRIRDSFDVRTDTKILRLFMTGKLPNKISSSETDSFFGTLPTPMSGALPKENCVTWTMLAIRALQDARFADFFDVEEFMWMAARAAHRVVDERRLPQADLCQNYTNRPM